MRRCVPQQKWTSIYRYQHIYMPILYTLLAFKTRYTDMLILFGDLSNGPLTMTVSKFDWNLMVGTKLFFVFYQFLAPWLFTDLSLGQVLALYAVAELASGTWLAYFFQVNHISYGLRYTTAQVCPSQRQVQIATLSCWESASFLTFIAISSAAIHRNLMLGICFMSPLPFIAISSGPRRMPPPVSGPPFRSKAALTMATVPSCTTS